MSYTAPPTFAADDELTAAELNILGDDIVYLKGATDGAAFSAVRLTRESGDTPLSVPNNTATDLTYVTEVFDVGGWWASGASATVPAGAIPAGYTTIAVLVIARCRFATNSSGSRQINLLVNGSAVESDGTSALDGDPTYVRITSIVTVESGDTIKLQALQTSGGALNVDVNSIVIARYAPAA